MATLLVAATFASDGAQARRRHHHRHHHHVSRYQPPTASIVVDGNSGKVLQASNADSLRHPASLTKMMTLYLLFERLAAGKITMTTPMPVSAHAAAQAPTKLGLQPGQTIRVEDAIKGIVTKSANDAAVVVAEALGGSELEFGRMMTAKAHALGMRHTNYHNASGLPDNRQLTTARDQAILARALQDRFPQYFHFFSIQTFVWHGRAMRNHNHLLGRVPGVDGMKTGYIRDFGFNIVVDVHRNKRHLVAVVFGGRTARARDARVRGLIDKNIRLASTKRSAPKVMEGWKAQEAVAELPTPSRDPRHRREAAAKPAPGSTAPIRPNLVKTVTVQPAAMHTASLAPPAAKTRATTGKALEVAKLTPTKLPVPLPAGARSQAKTAAPLQQVASAEKDVPMATSAREAVAKARGGYMIQVGAFDDEQEAKERLVSAKAKAKEQLIKADPFTEKIGKGSKSLYRARFAGLDRHEAESACRRLKHRDIPCFLLKN